MPDTGWTVEIVVDGTTYEFDLSPQFEFELDNIWKDNNERDRSEIAIPLYGRFRGDPTLGTGEAIAGDTWDQFFEVWDLIQHESPIMVRFYLNGTLKKEFSPAGFVKGPWIASYRSVDKEPNHVGNTIYELLIRMQSGIDGSSTSDNVNVIRSSRTETYNKRLQLREWILQFRGGNAEEKAKQALPASLIEKGLRVSLVRRIDLDIWETTVTWDRWQTDTKIVWTEKVEVRGGGSDPVFVTIPGGQVPLIFRTPLLPHGLVITGHIEALHEVDVEDFLPFPASLEGRFISSESSDSKHHDPKTGLWQRDYVRSFGGEVAVMGLGDPRVVELLLPVDESLKVDDSEVPGLL